MERIENALGYYEKRECPGGRTFFLGTAVHLGDGRYLFIPHDKKMKPVEATLEETGNRL